MEECDVWMPISYDVVSPDKYNHRYEFIGNRIYFSEYKDVRQDNVILLHPEEFKDRFAGTHSEVSLDSNGYMIYFHKEEIINPSFAYTVYMTVMECKFRSVYFRHKVVLYSEKEIVAAYYYDNGGARIPRQIFGAIIILSLLAYMWLFRYDIFEMS